MKTHDTMCKIMVKKNLHIDQCGKISVSQLPVCDVLFSQPHSGGRVDQQPFAFPGALTLLSCHALTSLLFP